MFVICRECGSANPASNQECRNCGMPLGVADDGGDYRTGYATPTPKPATDQPPATPVPTAKPSTAAPPTGGPRDVLQITTVSYTTKSRSDTPISLAVYYPQVLVAGHPAQIQLQIKNLTAKPVEQIAVSIASRGLAELITETFPQLPAQELLRFPVDLKVTGAGQFVLTYTVKLQTGGQWKNFIGARVMSVNPAAEAGAWPRHTDQIKLNRGESGITLKGLLADPGCPLKRPAEQPVASLAELQELKLPELFDPLELALDYQLSVSAVEESSRRTELYIPRLFVTNVQVGSKLKLTPANPEATLGIHLVARPQFKIGRSRMDADYVAWFWPRGHSNDERTRHLSRVHVFGELREGQISLRDSGSIGGSSFDGQPLAVDQWEPINRRGTLVMAGEYFLDVQPANAAYGGEPVIKNLKLWNGPAETAANPVKGTVHFTPLNTEPAHFHAVWLFTDAAFGTSRLNPIPIEDPGLMEIQGRFHYFRGAFWLENCAKNDAVRVNYYNLKANEIAPLINGQLVQIGQTNYHVEVLA